MCKNARGSQELHSVLHHSPLFTEAQSLAEPGADASWLDSQLPWGSSFPVLGLQAAAVLAWLFMGSGDPDWSCVQGKQLIQQVVFLTLISQT